MTPLPRRRSALLLLTTALLAGCGGTPAPPDAQPRAPVIWETASGVKLEEWTELVGSTQPLPQGLTHVTAPIDGRVVAVLGSAYGCPLREGDIVEQGDVIARLDDRIPRLNRDKAESAVKTAAAEKSQVQTALNLAADKLATLQKLRDKNASLVPDIDYKTAQGAVEDARSKLNVAEQHQDQASKDLDALNQQLQFYALTAPHRGRLGRVQASLGQTLAIGAEVAEVIDLEDQIDVLCFVSQRVAALMRASQNEGNALDAGLGGLDEKPDEARTINAPGSVVYIAERAEPETGCFAVKVRFPNNDLHLRANSVVRVRVLTRPGVDCLAIAESALMEDQEKPSVVIVEDVKKEKNADGQEEDVGTARRMRVNVGVRDRVLQQVEILGLEDPDGKWKGKLDEVLFVTKNGQGLQTGDAVRLENDDK